MGSGTCIINVNPKHELLIYVTWALQLEDKTDSLQMPILLTLETTKTGDMLPLMTSTHGPTSQSQFHIRQTAPSGRDAR